MQPVATSTIVVGERIRRDLGDLEALARSLREVQLQPIVVTPDRRLVAGERRLRACELAGIPVHIRIVATIKDAAAALRAEAAENLERLPWTPEETVRYGIRLRELEAPGAAERQAQGRAKGGRRRAGAEEASGQVCPEATGGEEGRVNGAAAKAVGMKRRTFEKAAKVIEAVDANPELAPLLDELNKTGRVDAVYRQLASAEASGGKVHDKDSYATPLWIPEGVRQVEGRRISLDPATNANAIGLGFIDARVNWTIDDDALEQPTWDVDGDGNTLVFMNPKYSDPSELVERLVQEWDEHLTGPRARAYVLTKLDTSTSWWSALRERAAAIVLPRKRVAHYVGGKPRKGSDFCSGMPVLARGTRAELLDLWARLVEAYEGDADVYLSAWVRKAPKSNDTTNR